MLSSLNSPQIVTIILVNPCDVRAWNEEAYHSIAMNETQLLLPYPSFLAHTEEVPRDHQRFTPPLWIKHGCSNVNEKRSLSEYGGGRLI